MTVSEFLKLGFSAWYELHWTLAATREQAKFKFEKRGLFGEFYQVPYGWWYPINEKDN